jgi:hypothetical protein
MTRLLGLNRVQFQTGVDIFSSIEHRERLWGQQSLQSKFAPGVFIPGGKVTGRDTFFCGVGLTPPLGPFFRSPRFRFLSSLRFKSPRSL